MSKTRYTAMTSVVIKKDLSMQIAQYTSFITVLQCFKQVFKVDDELGIVSIFIQDS